MLVASLRVGLEFLSPTWAVQPRGHSLKHHSRLGLRQIILQENKLWTHRLKQ